MCEQGSDSNAIFDQIYKHEIIYFSSIALLLLILHDCCYVWIKSRNWEEIQCLELEKREKFLLSTKENNFVYPKSNLTI